MINIENLNFEYENKTIFKNLNLKIDDNKISIIIGPNGVGKTTLVKLITNEIKTNNNIKNSFKKVFYLPQNPYYPKGITTFDYVSSVFYKNNWKWFLSTNEKEKIKEVLTLLELEDKKEVKIENLSGGEIQKANIALGLLSGADLFLLDEPTSNMDIINSIKIFDILKKLLEKNITSIIITHDINLSIKYGDDFIGINKNNEIIKGDKNSFFNNENLYKIFGINFEIIKDNEKIFIQTIN